MHPATVKANYAITAIHKPQGHIPAMKFMFDLAIATTAESPKRVVRDCPPSITLPQFPFPFPASPFRNSVPALSSTNSLPQFSIRPPRNPFPLLATRFLSFAFHFPFLKIAMPHSWHRQLRLLHPSPILFSPCGFSTSSLLHDYPPLTG